MSLYCRDCDVVIIVHSLMLQLTNMLVAVNGIWLDSSEQQVAPLYSFLCNTCPKAYKTQHSLTRHEKYECGKVAGSFKCPTCDSKYKRSDCMMRHFKYECGQTPRFTCPYCKYRCKQKGNLTVHLMRLHNQVL